MSMNLYRLKPASLRAVEPLVEFCLRRGIRPDTLTLLAVPVAFGGAVAIGVSPLVPGLLLLVPVAATLRLVLNLLDGAVARRTAAGRCQSRASARDH